MQPLTYQQTSGFSPTAVINRSQTKQAPGHEKIRDAVRAWSAADNQDVVAALIVNEYREQGGGTIDFPDDVSRARQKLFRFLDNKFDSEKYRNNVRSSDLPPIHSCSGSQLRTPSISTKLSSSVPLIFYFSGDPGF